MNGFPAAGALSTRDGDAPATERLTFAGDYIPSAESPPLHLQSGPLVANLECALARGATRAAKAYRVDVDAAALEGIRRAGVQAVSLANNHVFDSGAAAFRDLVSLLEDKYAIACFGLRRKPFVEFTVASKRCAIIGSLEPCRARGAELFRQEDVEALVRELRPGFDRVFVTPHWGKESEFAHHPAPWQRLLARRWIDAGADGVFGHHPHTVQGVEWHGARPIFYSLGNFAFQTEENRRYPLTRAGLCVRWSPGAEAPADAYDPVLIATDGPAAALSPAHDAAMKAFIARLSEDLRSESRPRPSYLAWARRVGPIYMAKSMSSWRLRLKRNPVRTMPFWVAWMLQPRTLLLTLGSFFPDEAFRAQRNALQRELAGEAAQGPLVDA